MKEKELIIKDLIIVLSIVFFYYLVFTGINQYIYNMNYLKCIYHIIFIFIIFIYIYYR